jgi:anti-sigma-K factor RskA
MTMRQKMDEYLDGALDAAGRQEVEAASAQDVQAAALLARMKRERALRTATYESYAPSEFEAGELAATVMAACEEVAAEPVGRIGHTGHFYWTRRLAGVAAAVVIAATAFAGGRMSAPQVASGPSTPSVVYKYVPVMPDPSGHVTEAVFDNREQTDAYVEKWAKQNGLRFGQYSNRTERARGDW